MRPTKLKGPTIRVAAAVKADTASNMKAAYREIDACRPATRVAKGQDCQPSPSGQNKQQTGDRDKATRDRIRRCDAIGSAHRHIR